MTAPEPLRPLLVGIDWDRPGGLNRYLRGLRDGLEAGGVATRTLVLGPATDPPPAVRVLDDAEAPLLRRLHRYACAARQEAAADPVVDAHFALFVWWPVLVGRLRSAPLVVHFHGPWAQESLAEGDAVSAGVRVKQAVERAVYRRADRVVVLSEAFRQLLVEQYDVAPWRIRVLPPGVELERFTPDREAARARLGLSDEQVVFTARRLVPRMGLDVLLEAWAALPASTRPRQLMIAGEGPSADDLAAQVERLGLRDSVRLLGRIDEADLVDHYRAADLCVVHSVALEGFGLVVVEALACGTPVVATDVGGLPEALRGLDPSLVVPSGDPAALAARLASALAGEVPSAERCRAHAETFTWERAAVANAAVYARAREARRGLPAADARLTVVYLDHCAQLSGAEIALSRLLPALPEVDALGVLGEDGPLVAELRSVGISTSVRPLSGAAGAVRRDEVRPGALPWRPALDALRSTVALARHLRRLRPDLVHTNSLKAALYGTVAGRLAGVPVVWHARDRVSEDYLPAPAARLVRALAARLPAVVVANSRATLETLQLPAGSAGVVVADPYDGSALPASTRRDDGELVVGMVGRLSPWKGQHVFLEAFARARRTGRERAVLVGSALFGEQDYEQQLRRQAADLGLADVVTFAGFRPDIAVELAGFDVLVHASVLPEPFGQVLVEGMAAGLPVVASGAGGAAEIVTDGVDGLLHPPGDVAALTRCLDRLLGEPALRASLGEQARRSAERFRPEVVGPQVMSAYRTALERR